MEVNQVNMNGEELINLTEDTVTEEVLLAGRTAHAANGEKIEGKLALYAPNYVDNPDFSINQRGIAQYSASGTEIPCVDRWRFGGDDDGIGSPVTFTRNASLNTGIISYMGEGGGCAWLTQKIDAPERFADKEMTFTVSFSFIFRDVSIGIYQINDTGDVVDSAETAFSEDEIHNVTIKPIHGLSLVIKIIAKGEAWIDGVSLAIGNGEYLPLPTESALELIKCQRYLAAVSGYSRYVATRLTTNEIDFFIPLPTTLKGTPKIDTSNLVIMKWDGTTATNVTEGFAFTIATTSNNGVVIRGTKAAHGVTAGYLEFKTKSTPFLLSCE
jgi:hypothetical protein